MKRARGDAGFTLAGLICVLTAVAITSAVMVPLRVMQTKRENEKELIFRGEEYVRAIRKYQRKYQAYPAAIDDLITRDGFRFLRKQYKDPISGEDFRLITVNSDGTLTGSVTMLSLPVSTQPGAGGNVPTPGSIPGGVAPGQLPTAGGGQNSGGQGGQANTNNIGGISGFGGGMNSGTSSGINGVSNPFASGGGQNNSGRPQGVGTGVGSGVGTGGGALGIGGSPVGIGSTGGNNPQNNSNLNTPGSIGGGGGGALGPGAPSAIANNAFTAGAATAQISPGLAGVGSQSTGTAVMVYNTKEKYNEWEFIAPREQTAGVPNGQSGPNAQSGPNNPNGPRPSGTGPNANPFGGGGNPLSGGTSPFGGGGNPLGGGFGGGNTLGGGGTNQPRPSGPVGVGPGGRP